MSDYPEGVTQSEHVAHDMRAGRFPKQSTIDEFLKEREAEAQRTGLREKVARCIIGPRNPVPATAKFTLDELRDVRWTSATTAERNDALWAADAILDALLPLAAQTAGQEPVRWRHECEGRELVRAFPLSAEERLDGWTETPLYDHPAPAADPSRDERIRALEAALARGDRRRRHASRLDGRNG